MLRTQPAVVAKTIGHNEVNRDRNWSRYENLIETDRHGGVGADRLLP